MLRMVKRSREIDVESMSVGKRDALLVFRSLCKKEDTDDTKAQMLSLELLQVWARICTVIANHFIYAGSHADEKVVVYAIDSLMHLVMKYLEHTELTNFTFQNDILKPFVVLLRNSQSEAIGSLIVDCIVQLIKSNVSSIKSGRQSVFMIFTTAADDDFESIIEKAFEIVDQRKKISLFFHEHDPSLLLFCNSIGPHRVSGTINCLGKCRVHLGRG